MRVKDIAASAQTAMSLGTEELAWAILGELKSRGGREHSANFANGLAHLYDNEPETSRPRNQGEQAELRKVMAEALGHLVSWGLVAVDHEYPATAHVVTRKGAALDTAETFKRFLVQTAVQPQALHIVIRTEAWPLYIRGKFDTAVFEAFKQVEIAVREAAKLPVTEIGVTLMRNAFKPQTGALCDVTIPAAEQEAIMHLFAGAVGAFKNPNSHREVGLDDPAHAAELLMLASHLMRIVDQNHKTA